MSIGRRLEDEELSDVSVLELYLAMGVPIFVRILRKCALRETTKRLMHWRRIDRALTRAPFEG